MEETQRDNEETNATNPVGKTENFVSKHFIWLLVGLAVVGGILALLVPWLLYVKGWTGETDANLRLHILYVTGGTIAVLGLVETHRKNTTDRIKAEADIQNYQASQDHQAKTLNEQARQFTETIAKEREKSKLIKPKTSRIIYDRYTLSDVAGTALRLSSFLTIRHLSALAVSTLS